MFSYKYWICVFLLVHTVFGMQYINLLSETYPTDDIQNWIVSNTTYVDDSPFERVDLPVCCTNRSWNYSLSFCFSIGSKSMFGLAQTVWSPLLRVFHVSAASMEWHVHSTHSTIRRSWLPSYQTWYLILRLIWHDRILSRDWTRPFPTDGIAIALLCGGSVFLPLVIAIILSPSSWFSTVMVVLAFPTNPFVLLFSLLLNVRLCSLCQKLTELQQVSLESVHFIPMAITHVVVLFDPPSNQNGMVLILISPWSLCHHHP